MTTSGGLLRTQRDLLKSKILKDLDLIEKKFKSFPNLRILVKSLDLEELKEIAQFTALISSIGQGNSILNPDAPVVKTTTGADHE